MLGRRVIIPGRKIEMKMDPQLLAVAERFLNHGDLLKFIAEVQKEFKQIKGSLNRLKRSQESAVLYKEKVWCL